jgi:hypothetical protein
MAPYSSETSANITPLTTMMAAFMEENSGTTAAQAKTKVATALGLAESDVIADPVALATTKPEVLNAALHVQKAVEVIATATTGDDTGTKATNAFKALVSGVANATAATDVKAGVQALITAAKSSSKVDSGKADAIEAAAKAVSDVVDASIGTGGDAEAIQKAVLVIDDAKTEIETKETNGDTTGYETVTTDAATAMTSTTTWQEMLVQSFLDQLGSSADAGSIATDLGASVTAGMTWEAFETALTTKGGYGDVVTLIKKRIIKGYIAGQTFYVAHPEWSSITPVKVIFNATATSASHNDLNGTSVTLTETGFIFGNENGMAGTFTGMTKSSDGTYYTATFDGENPQTGVRLYLSETAAIAYQG